MNSLEQLILSALVFNESYSRAVLPYLNKEYFSNPSDSLLYTMIDNYIEQYNVIPSKTTLLVELENKKVSSDLYEETQNKINELKEITGENEWIIDKTEKFCQDKAIYNAIMESISIMEGETDKGKGVIPEILSNALAVSFDDTIGHDFFKDLKSRFESYHASEMRIPFDLEYLNIITKGGLPRKTLNMALGGTGVGKTLFLCHLAASYTMMGYNVLYITAEMAEERIAERIDSNLLDITLDSIKDMPYEYYEKAITKKRNKTTGELVIKEYPTAAASSTHIKTLLRELKIKKSFTPDVIIADYLNIFAAARFKGGANVNSYTYVKAIAEEFRGIAVEHNCLFWSATQTTRSGFESSDLELSDTSESFALPATADFMIGLITSEEMEKLNQLMIKQLKNRFGALDKFKRFYIGVDKSRMKLYDIEQSGQKTIEENNIFDSTSVGEAEAANKNSNTLASFNF